MTNNVRVVLVGTHHPENIGSSARAMKTMGLSQLHLVNPRRFPCSEATTLASGADDVLTQAQVHTTLAAAVAPCTLVLGATARSRKLAIPVLSPVQAAQQLVAAAARGPVALVFGTEATGLDNQALQLCHAAVCIPANPQFSSLNLAAAVQVLAYEVHQAAHGSVTDAASPETPVSTHAQAEDVMAQLAAVLEHTGFHKGRSSEEVLQRLRLLLVRASPDTRELALLRAILAETLAALGKRG